MGTKRKKEVFHSKVMLFGEYSIIMGSMGLTIPYSHFNGELRFINKDSYTDLDFAKESNRQITELVAYIEDLHASGQLLAPFDYQRLRNDLKKGLYFESTIPEGYGLGSSGALVAALYNEYGNGQISSRNEDDVNHLLELKKQFAQIESFYHGTSSGIDPLICFLKHPIVLENNNKISSVGITRKEMLQEDAIFLINSGKPGKTGPLVKIFMEKTKEDGFRNALKDLFIPLTNACIQSLLKGELSDLFSNLKNLSAFQLEYLPDMITAHTKPLWENGLKTGLYTLKLCGSGGGGFVLGFTRQYQKTKAFFQEQNIEMIPVYREVIS